VAGRGSCFVPDAVDAVSALDAALKRIAGSHAE
jgi:hypothetical protein